MIAVIDYGVGNLFSLASSLDYIGVPNLVTRDEATIRAADKIILPGVGAFSDAAHKLRETGLVAVIKEECAAGKMLLGICLGMQMLFEKSYEHGEWEGLGLIPGSVRPLTDDIPATLKVPQIGWNRLEVLREDPFFRYFDGGHVYYVHSYYAKDCEPYVLATSSYGVDVPGVVRCGTVYGCQFHPEKSGQVGLGLLRAFAEGKAV